MTKISADNQGHAGFKDRSKRFKIVVFALCATLVIAGAFAGYNRLQNPKAPALPRYQVVPPFSFKLSIVETGLGFITRIKLKPDHRNDHGQKVMLVATLEGKVWVFRRQADGMFRKQSEPFAAIDLGFPANTTGMPRESGLTGLAFAADFETSKDVFVTFAHKVPGAEGPINEIFRYTYSDRGGIIRGENPVSIFDANEFAQLAHQIQGAVGIRVQDKPMLLFSIGDSTRAKLAQDPSKEAGKFMLIDRDGNPAPGARPFPAWPKIQAIGIRNAYDLAVNPFDPARRLASADSGPDKNDRFFFGQFVEYEGKAANPLNFNWNGLPDDLTKKVADTLTTGHPDMLAHIWNVQMTPTDICFYAGGRGNIPASDRSSSAVLVNLWGQYSSNAGRKIVVGRLSHPVGAQPRIDHFEDMVVRLPEGQNPPTPGTPLGLACDSDDGSIYFGDLISGDLYQLKP